MSGKNLDGVDDPIADGIISDCLVTDWTIPDVFLAKLMEKASWAALAVRWFSKQKPRIFNVYELLSVVILTHEDGHQTAPLPKSHVHQPLPHWHHGYSLFRALLIVSNEHTLPVFVRFGILH